MELTDQTFQQLRDLAKKHGINSFSKGRDDLIAELQAAGIDATPAVKGKPSWRPARMLDLENRANGYRYRWCDTDDANLRKKLAEGWVYVNKETGHPVEHIDPDLQHGGKSPDGSVKYRDLIVMALPEEIAQQRDEYFAELSKNQLEGVNENAASNMEKVGPMATTRKGKLEITRIN